MLSKKRLKSVVGEMSSWVTYYGPNLQIKLDLIIYATNLESFILVGITLSRFET